MKLFLTKKENKTKNMKETTTRSIQEIINNTYKKYNITFKNREDLYRDCGTLISVDDYCTEHPDSYCISKNINAINFDKKMEKIIKSKKKEKMNLC